MSRPVYSEVLWRKPESLSALQALQTVQFQLSPVKRIAGLCSVMPTQYVDAAKVVVPLEGDY